MGGGSKGGVRAGGVGPGGRCQWGRTGRSFHTMSHQHAPKKFATLCKYQSPGLSERATQPKQLEGPPASMEMLVRNVLASAHSPSTSHTRQTFCRSAFLCAHLGALAEEEKQTTLRDYAHRITHRSLTSNGRSSNHTAHTTHHHTHAARCVHDQL